AGQLAGELHVLANTVFHGLELRGGLSGRDHEPVERLRGLTQVEHGDVHRALVVERVDDRLDLLRHPTFGRPVAGCLGTAGRIQTFLRFCRHDYLATSATTAALWSTLSAASDPSTSSSRTGRPAYGSMRSICCLLACSSSAK